MNITVIAFAVCLLVALAFLFAMTWQALSDQRTGKSHHRTGFTQSGDTSLGDNSINWMAGIALSLAVWVCFFVI